MGPVRTFKVVYWGPQGAGKTTNLRVLERRTPPAKRSELTSIQAHDRGCSFELLALDLGRHGGAPTRLELLSVPGCPACAATRGLVLERTDGVVFVADGDPLRVAATKQSALDLVSTLRAQGRDPDQVPIVIQLNKRELPRASSVEALLAALRPLGRRPLVQSVATLGEGVLPTLREATQGVLAAVARREFADPPALPPGAPAKIDKNRTAQTVKLAPPPQANRGPERGRSGRQAPALAGARR
jgi:signal recognition particle receptor subunit beta